MACEGSRTLRLFLGNGGFRWDSGKEEMVIWCVSLPEDLRLIYKLHTGDSGQFLTQRWSCHRVGPTDALVCMAHPTCQCHWSLQTLGAAEQLASWAGPSVVLQSPGRARGLPGQGTRGLASGRPHDWRWMTARAPGLWGPWTLVSWSGKGGWTSWSRAPPWSRPSSRGLAHLSKAGPGCAVRKTTDRPRVRVRGEQGLQEVVRRTGGAIGGRTWGSLGPGSQDRADPRGRWASVNITHCIQESSQQPGPRQTSELKCLWGELRGG